MLHYTVSEWGSENFQRSDLDRSGPMTRGVDCNFKPAAHSIFLYVFLSEKIESHFNHRGIKNISLKDTLDVVMHRTMHVTENELTFI